MSFVEAFLIDVPGATRDNTVKGMLGMLGGVAEDILSDDVEQRGGHGC